MNSKLFIWVGFFVGSLAGSYIPSLWGAGPFSFTAIITGALGALVGIWLGYKLSF